MRSYLVILSAISVLLFNACATSESTQVSAELAGDALYRPVLHFTPEAHWMNDPNGLFFDGVDTYHLYYQYYPDSTVWGPMHWGHATTKDLIHWEHQPVALAPDELGYIFSGSAVVDVKNTSGLGSVETPAVVAIYTYHRPSDYLQTQGIAYSLDGGYTFTKYANNPVLANPGEQDFRDPKVSWHEASSQWIMALAVGQHIRFYSSPNLTEWTYLSSFGEGVGAHGGVWECPDLIPFTASDGAQKWVLFVSINPGHPAGGSGTQYFVGDFDGVTFTPDEADPPLLWLDAGRDNYAGVTFHQKGLAGSGSSPLFIGWMSNWEYGQQVPTKAWRSAMTLPRDLSLQLTPKGYRLNQWATSNLFATESWKEIKKTVEGYQIEDAHQLVIEWEGAGSVGLMLHSEAGDTLTLHADEQGVTVDRRGMKNLDFSPKFASVEHVDLLQQGDGKHLVILDGSSLEYLGESGLVSLTDLYFVKQWFSHLEVDAQEDITVQVMRLNQAED
jgi:fructan beta-fructosidase